ncbi:MAG: glycosyltransferase family 2 protein [Bacteroidales bacterium]|nr:glycosyltransferase family 2 protein [Bacteroidales bacterium]MCF8388380.1 glycosyltransferase family 2 protein [Bacteroidales bacterium]MCF8396537.1 glycosyltransferase family 2 protein [Bacteroidales bacterium]
MNLSIIIPLYNEEESLPELHEWIRRVVKENNLSYEIIFVDDGSSDNSWKVIEGIAGKDPNVKGIKFRRNYGKSAALNSGFDLAVGEVVITMDADLQDSPDEIPELYKMVHEEGYELVSGWKKKRHDPLGKKIPSRLFNLTTRRMSGIKLHDFNCGLKAYKNEVVKNIEVYGEMHRYIPVIAKWEGYKNIGEKIVKHRARKYGVTKFGMSRFIKGYLDLLTINFVSKFGKRPMHLFGTLGSLIFFLGFVIAAYLAYAKFFLEEYRMTERPLFYFGLLAMIIGTQLFVAGFLAEMISRTGSERNQYSVEKMIDKPKE